MVHQETQGEPATYAAGLQQQGRWVARGSCTNQVDSSGEERIRYGFKYDRKTLLVWTVCHVSKKICICPTYSALWPSFCCRIIRNVTKPLASHSIQAMRPSNLDSMRDSFHLEDRSSISPTFGTLRSPVHFDAGGSNATVMMEPGPHAYYNPYHGSILTKTAAWSPLIAESLGLSVVPGFDIEDQNWWSDMTWFMNSTLNMTHPPATKTTVSRRYWDWDSRFPSTYPRYSAPWPNDSWIGAAWPAHLYGTLPSTWGELSPDNNKRSKLYNLRIMWEG